MHKNKPLTKIDAICEISTASQNQTDALCAP